MHYNILKFRPSILILVSALIVTSSGCSTLDPYTGESKTSSSTKGGAIGAGIGALLGYASARDKDRRERQKAILVGAGVGGVTGAGIGGYMDHQELKLRKQLEGSGVSVTRTGDDVILNMPGNVTFASGSSDLKPDFTEVLDSVVLVLNEFDQTLIEVAGHTDSVGSDSSNMTLSHQRARIVSDYLTSQKIIPGRVVSLGHGESRPIADNETEQGRELNRRVELTLIPVKAAE